MKLPDYPRSQGSFQQKQLKRILFIGSYPPVSLAFDPLFGVGASVPVRILLVGLTLWLFRIATIFSNLLPKGLLSGLHSSD